MVKNEINITKFLTLSLEEQVGNGINEFGQWYDWFCTDKGLVKRGEALVSKLKSIQNSKRFDPNTTYVFFKNNCPLNGDLYDDFRICDIATGNVIFTVVPKSGHTCEKGKGSVWGKSDNGTFCEVFSGTWKEIKNWFNSVN
jgi:hypothetical protein